MEDFRSKPTNESNQIVGNSLINYAKKLSFLIVNEAKRKCYVLPAIIIDVSSDKLI